MRQDSEPAGAKAQAIKLALTAVAAPKLIKAWWRRSGEGERYQSHFKVVDQIFKPVQWLVVILTLFRLAVTNKTTISLFNKLVILAILLGLFFALVSLLAPLVRAINPEGRGRVYRVFACLFAVTVLVVFFVAFNALVATYLPAPPPRPRVEPYPYG
jgi:hypothetical protein